MSTSSITNSARPLLVPDIRQMPGGRLVFLN